MSAETCGGCRFLITERFGSSAGALICTNKELIAKTFSDGKYRTLTVTGWKNIKEVPATRPAWCKGAEP